MLEINKIHNIVWIVGGQTINGSETGTSFKQALYFKKIGFNLYDTMIYKKSYLPKNDMRYEQEFEYMFIFSKGKIKTFNPIMIKSKLYGQKRSGGYRQQNGEVLSLNTKGKIKEYKLKGNIWFYDVGFNKTTNDKIAFKHPAIFPEQLVSDHIISWSNENDIVLDPFIGSGTTAKMCLLLNRQFIGFEISKEYCEIANKRIDFLQRQQRLF